MTIALAWTAGGGRETLAVMGLRLSLIFIAAAGLVPAAAPLAQDAGLPPCERDAMVVFDGSGSMAEMGYNLLKVPRIFEARTAIHKTIPQIAAVRRLGLIVYGPGTSGRCGGVDLRFAPRRNAAAPIIAAVDGLEPEGETPLTEAVAEAAKVLKYRSKPGDILLVTDGKETCGGDPCAVAAELASQARDLKIDVIGFRVQGAHFAFPGSGAGDYSDATSDAICFAKATGGKYYKAENVDDLAKAFLAALGCPLFSLLPPMGPVRPLPG